MTRRFSPGRWAVGAAAALLAGAGVAVASHHQPAAYPPPAGWVEVPCEPWPGGPGPCYAPPDGDSYTYDGQRCTVQDGRNVCVWLSTEPTPAGADPATSSRRENS